MVDWHSAKLVEWKANWRLLVAVTLGFSLPTVLTYSFGLFIQPLSAEFGWNRSEMSFGLTIVGLVSVPLSPVVGAMVDRWGSRRIAIPGILLLAISIASFGLASGSLTQWLALWAIYAVVELGTKSTVWMAAVTGVFNEARGLALGIAMCGAAMAQVLAPPLSFWLIELFGWRLAFVALGLGWGGVTLLCATFFLFDAHDRHKRRAVGTDPRPPDRFLPGLTVREAIRSIILWRIALASLLTMTVGVGVMVHQVPILTDAGVTTQRAAILASFAGVAGICGKLMTGHLMDRSNASWVGALTLASSAVGFFLLLEPVRSSGMIVLGMAIIGYSTGAKLQISAYLVSRYGGIRNFGKIYGTIVSLIGIGASFGPVLAGGAYDFFGSYSALLIAGIPTSILSGLLILGLGPAPAWTDAR